MTLYLRKVQHPHQATENYRVILKVDETEFEIGSIGITLRTGIDPIWTWGIDTVIPMRAIESEGDGRNRDDCVKRFKSAWEKFSADPARLTEFLEAKRRAKRR